MRPDIVGKTICGIFAVSMMSCSVKEDREVCPCFLSLDFSSVEFPGDSLHMINLDIEGQRGFLFTDTLTMEGSLLDGHCMTLYTVDVPRDCVLVNVVADAQGHLVAGNGLSVPEGLECPPVYMFTRRYDTSVEQVRDTVVLHKNYCKVMMYFNEKYPYALEVSGNVCGYDIEGRPMRGNFRCRCAPGEGGFCSVNIPRQIDSSLVLRIISDSKVLRSFALGEYIIASGYDWGANELDDVRVDIDLVETAVIFRISRWVESFQLEVLI